MTDAKRCAIAGFAVTVEMKILKDYINGEQKEEAMAKVDELNAHIKQIKKCGAMPQRVDIDEMITDIKFSLGHGNFRAARDIYYDIDVALDRELYAKPLL